MTVECANVFTSDGRLRGSYVYMLLCQVEEPIHIKVGRSCWPLSQLDRLRDAQVISVAEVASLRKAVAVESDLRVALARWLTCANWFTVLPAERADFNAAWKPVIAAHSEPSRRIDWRNYSIPLLISAAKERQQVARKRFMGRSLAYQNFQNA